MKITLIITLVVFFTYAIVLLFARLFAEKIIFPAPKASYSDNGKIIYLPQNDGEKIAAVFLPAKESKICAIYAHGNGEDIGEIYPLLEKYAASGVSVFAFDYIGYGLSSGKPSIKGFKNSAATAYEYVSKKLGFADSQIVVVGYSLGSAAACEIFSRHPNVRCAVIIGGFSKAVKAVLPFNIIPWEILDNSSKISKFENPILFLHGKRDMVVPFRNAKENYAAANKNNKRLIAFAGVGHYGLPACEQYWNEILTFIQNPIETIKNPENEKSSCITI